MLIKEYSSSTDVLRATSSMCIAFEKGVEKLIPVSTVEEALEYRNGERNYILAESEMEAQRVLILETHLKKVSRYGCKGKVSSYDNNNGTKCINIAKKDHDVVVGSF